MIPYEITFFVGFIVGMGFCTLIDWYNEWKALVKK